MLSFSSFIQSISLLIILAASLGLSGAVLATRAQLKAFSVNASSPIAPWTQFFRETVGSGHAALALRADYQEQLTRAHAEAGFRTVRFHGLFVDDMSVVLPGDNGAPYLFSFFNVDRIFDFLLGIGMKPFVEISFMPNLLASSNKTWSHYDANVSPPKNWDDWASLIKAFISHLIQRYGIQEVSQWNFEVWNEPNCCPSFFYTGNMTDYFQLYSVTALAAKSVDSRIKVGGPASAMSAWIPEFIAFCKSNNVPYDFITTHEYPTDPPGPYTRDFVSNVIRNTRQVVGSNTPLYYTEFNGGIHDALPYAAAFLPYQAYRLNGYVDSLSWWTFSDIFEENGMFPTAFSDGPMPYWGLMNVYGIPKPTYRAYQLLSWTGNTVLSSFPPVETYDTISVFAIGGNGTSIFLTNWNLPENQTISAETALITVSGISASQMQGARLYRVDNDHAYAYKTWVELGKPLYLSPKQVALLNKASELVPEPVTFSQSGADIVLTITVPPNALVNIVIPDEYTL